MEFDNGFVDGFFFTFQFIDCSIMKDAAQIVGARSLTFPFQSPEEFETKAFEIIY